METVLFQNVQTAASSISDLQVQFKRLTGVAKAIEHRSLAKELKQITNALEEVVGLSQHLSIMHKTVGEVMYATDEDLLKRKVSFQAEREAIREKLVEDDVSSDSGEDFDDSGEDSNDSGDSSDDSAEDSGESDEDTDGSSEDCDSEEDDETDDEDGSGEDSSDDDTTPARRYSSLQSDSDSDDDWVPKRKRQRKKGRCLIVSSGSDSEDEKATNKVKGKTPPTLVQTASTLATETINTAIGNITSGDKSNDSSEVTSTGSYDKVSKKDLDK